MTPSCRDIRHRLALRPPGAPLEHDLAAHLAACADCRRSLAASEALWEQLGQYQAPALELDLFPHLEQRLRLEKPASATARGRLPALVDLFPRHPAFVGFAALGATLGILLGTLLARTNVPNPSRPVDGDPDSITAVVTAFDLVPTGFLPAGEPTGDLP